MDEQKCTVSKCAERLLRKSLLDNISLMLDRMLWLDGSKLPRNYTAGSLMSSIWHQIVLPKSQPHQWGEEVIASPGFLGVPQFSPPPPGVLHLQSSPNRNCEQWAGRTEVETFMDITMMFFANVRSIGEEILAQITTRIHSILSSQKTQQFCTLNWSTQLETEYYMSKCYIWSRAEQIWINM